jgi:MerR family mercuric resistance operon transcriptional regulator
LDEIGQLLKLEDGTHCSEAAELATLRLADVRGRLANLKRMEVALLSWWASAEHIMAIFPAR